MDGLLQYSRVGRAPGAAEPVDVGALVEDVVDLLAPPPEAEVSIAPDLPTIVTDPLPLRQVFQNLIGNAL